MRCIVCGRKVDSQDFSTVLGPTCENCVPRGEAIPFQIRHATSSEDNQFVLQFLDDLFGETEFIEFGKWYRVEDMTKLVAVGKDGEYVGFAVYLAEDKDLMTLLTINVARDFLRRGIASALLEEVKRVARESGLKEIRVPISNDDLASYIFYHRRGFRLYGIDVDLCTKRHGGEEEGFWKLPLRDELYLIHPLSDGA